MGINTAEGRKEKSGSERTHPNLYQKKKRDPFDSLAVFTGDVHAGVDGSGGLDGGRGVSAVHLVRLSVLSFAVDHRQAQTQALSERLSSASTKSNTRAHTQSNARRRMWDVRETHKS